MREKTVEQYLVDRVKELGGEVRKLKWIGRRSAPDRAVCLAGFTLVEVKRPGKHLSEAQSREFLRLMRTGVRCVWVNCFEHVDTLWPKP